MFFYKVYRLDFGNPVEKIKFLLEKIYLCATLINYRDKLCIQRKATGTKVKVSTVNRFYSTEEIQISK